MSHHGQGQCIHCNVGSCRYNEQQSLCALQEIQVAAKPGCSSAKPDESVCASYKSRG